MDRVKLINKELGIKSFDAYREELEDRVLEMTESVLNDAQKSLEGELEGVGLLAMRMIMEAEREAVVGARYKHIQEREYVRGGSNPGSVILNGRRVSSKIPRIVEKDTKKSYPLKTHAVFSRLSYLSKRAYNDLIRGISTRQYKQGISRFLDGYGMSSSTISRHMVSATGAKLQELLERRLEDIDIAVVLIDGVQLGGQTIVVALGIDTQGIKHVLGMWQGSTENKTVVRSLVVDLIERGLDAEGLLLFVIDGSKALRGAIREVFGNEAPVQRCTVHKKRNVLDLLPEGQKHRIKQRMNEAYNMLSYHEAKKRLLQIADELELLNPSAARSMREGLDETLTLHRLGIDGTMRKTLQTTNLVESVIAVLRYHTGNVKHWQSGMQRERWIAAGLLEAEKNFRRIKGYSQINILIDSLRSLRNQKLTAA